MLPLHVAQKEPRLPYRTPEYQTSAAAGRGASYWRPSARACASASEETKFQAAVINLPVQLQS